MHMLKYMNETEFRFAVISDSPSTPLKITKFEVTIPDFLSGCSTGGVYGTLPDDIVSDPVGSDKVTPSGLGGGMIALIVIAVLVVLAGVGFAMYKTGVLRRNGYV